MKAALPWLGKGLVARSTPRPPHRLASFPARLPACCGEGSLFPLRAPSRPPSEALLIPDWEFLLGKGIIGSLPEALRSFGGKGSPEPEPQSFELRQL